MAEAADNFAADVAAAPVITNDRRSPEADGGERRSTRRRSRSRSRSRSPYRRDRSPPRTRGPAPPPGGRAGPPVDPSNVLGVFGLSILTTERDLHHEFSAFGTVEKVVIVYDQRSDRSRGFGFVTMGDQEEAAKAIEGLNGLELHQRRMRVDYSATKKPHEPTPGQYMGLPTRSDDRYAAPRGPPRYGGYDRGDRYGGYDSGRRSPPRRRFDDYDRDYDRRDRDRDRRRDRSRSRDRRSRSRSRDRDHHRSSRRRRSPSYGRERSRSRSPAPRKVDADKEEVAVPAAAV